MMKERQSNIELLRIVAIIGVIVLHYNNPSIGGGIAYAQEGSINYYILYFLESLFACGVDLFIIISGYFMCTSYKKNMWRLVELIVQVIIFREALYLVRVAFKSELFSIRGIVSAFIPANYFVILYGVVFILSPYINFLLNRLSEKCFHTLMIVSICLFSVYPTLIDILGEIRGEPFRGLSSIGMYGSQWGYSAINFLLMYLVGAYLRKECSRIHNAKEWQLLIGLVISIIITVFWARINDIVGFFTERSAWEYCNPLIILIAVFLFELFSRINLGSKKIINTLAEGVFTVFLLHSVFIPYLQIEKFVNENPVVMILHIIMCVSLIYLVCWCVHKAYHLITDPIFKVLSKKYKNFCIEVETQE